MTRSVRHPRHGMAALWAIAVLTCVAALSAVAVGRYVAGRRALDDYRHRTQAEWLALGGVELAAGRLLEDPDAYSGETVKPLPRAEVRIVVRKEAAEPGLYRVESTARYPSEGRGTAVRTVTRWLKRTGTGKEARIEVVPREPEPAAKPPARPGPQPGP